MSWAKRKWRWALAGGALISAVAIASTAFGLFDSGSTSEPGAEPVAADANGVGEGIQVHGDWVIEVRNTDGSLAERRDFENVLLPTGQKFLANVLARQYFVGTWGIWAYDPAGQSPCTGNLFCQIEEPNPGGFTVFNVGHFPTLTITTDPAPCCNGTTMVLQGNFDAQINGIVSRVSTLYCHTLPPNPDPTTCNNVQEFTGTGFTPINVVAGQQVLVTVRISFS